MKTFEDIKNFLEHPQYKERFTSLQPALTTSNGVQAQFDAIKEFPGMIAFIRPSLEDNLSIEITGLWVDSDGNIVDREPHRTAIGSK